MRSDPSSVLLRAGESFQIGLSHGSCAAAAYLGRPVYSVDIEKTNMDTFGDVALQTYLGRAGRRRSVTRNTL